MLTGFRVKNFKAFEDTTSIDLKPLVLLSGINSAGKSSILQALLLLKQTLESSPGHVLNPSEPLFLGSLDNFLFGGGGENRNLTYNLTFTYPSQIDRFAPIDNHPPANRPELMNTLDVAFPDVNRVSEGNELTCHLQLTFAWGKFGYLEQREVRLNDLQISIEIDAKPLLSLDISPRSARSYRTTLLEKGTSPELQDLAIERLEVDSFDHFLPESFIISQSEEPDISRRELPPRLAQFLRQLFRSIQSDLAEKTYYLSSFRDPPSHFYGYSHTTDSLDFQGNNFPQVLWKHHDTPVHFVHPDFPYPDKKRRYEMPLGDAVPWILREVLGLDQPVKVQPVGSRSDLLEVKVETLGKHSVSVTLGDVGLGYNQILPVIVQGLLTPPGGLVIFEQPEIHLHPDVQAKLVKFFVGLVRSGRRVLVETHSNHMVDHLCLAIAEDQGPEDWLVNNASVLFIHPPDQDHAAARIEPVQIDPYGHILNWPPHFMPDTAGLYESILKAGFAKRRIRQVSQPSSENLP